jgi:hypothetical protein
MKMAARENSIRSNLVFTVIYLAICCPRMATAHHGWVAHYDRDQHVTIQGFVRDIQFVNPHTYVYIDTVNDNNEAEVRWCEMQARTQLQRRGVTLSSFEVGGPITVSGFASRRDPMGCETGTVSLTDGQEVVFRHRDGQSVYGAPQIAGDQTIFGSWYPKVFLAEAGSETDSRIELTSDGVAAHENFDWISNNPTLSCSPASNIRAWAAPGLPTQIRREEDTIILQHEFMDVVRRIDMNVTEHNTNVSRSDLGHSIARFEGSDLVIETSYFAAGALWAGRLNTEDLQTTERLSVDADSGELRLDWTATDKAYYAEPLRGTRVLIRTDIPIGRFDCIPEAGHRPRDGYEMR